jgi:hypothetical protein
VHLLGVFADVRYLSRRNTPVFSQGLGGPAFGAEFFLQNQSWVIYSNIFLFTEGKKKNVHGGARKRGEKLSASLCKGGF